jgi:hypothetical protein
MRVSHERVELATPEKAFDRLQVFLAQQRSSPELVEDREAFEQDTFPTA